MEDHAEYTQGKGLKRKETPGKGSKLRKDTLGGGWDGRNETLGGGSELRKEAQCSGLRLRFTRDQEELGQEGNISEEGECVQGPREGSTPGGAYDGRRRKRASRPTTRKQRDYLASSSNEEGSSSPRKTRNRGIRMRHSSGRARKRRHASSTSSGSESEAPKRSRYRGEKRDVRLVDKFLSILEKVKGSDKPKITFNTNVIPEFDPLSKEQTMLTWLTKVEECAEIYGWEEREIIHYSLPKLTGVAKTWYQGLTTVLHTWSEWKKKLLESFPCREDYAELLTEMLAKRAKYG